MAYIDQDDLEDRWGTENIARWSNLAGGTTADTARITKAIAYAEALVENKFRGSRYTVPFVATGSDYDLQLKDWMAVHAGHWLYSSRQIRGAVQDAERTSRLVVEVEAQIDAVLSSQASIASAEAYPSSPDAPSIIM